MRTAVFESSRFTRQGWQVCFDHPQAVHAAHTHQEVLQVIGLAEAAARAGRWVAMIVAYEAAAAFDTAMKTHPPGDLPLAWVAVFDEPRALTVVRASRAYAGSSWQAFVAIAVYVCAI